MASRKKKDRTYRKRRGFLQFIKDECDKKPELVNSGLSANEFALALETLIKKNDSHYDKKKACIELSMRLDGYSDADIQEVLNGLE